MAKPRRRRLPADNARTANGLSHVRLQKVLAAAGIGSRRQCEELIRQGRVDVDGQPVAELGTRVDPARQKISVDGEMLRRPKRKLYFLVNKPAGVLSTSHDPAGRPRVIDLAPSQERLFTVGRLDKSSGGLILVTNDGTLTDLLTHPRYGVEKTYAALVAGIPTPEALAKLQRGVHLAEGFAHAKRVQVRRAHRHSTLLEIVLDEGRNREVRRLLARIGHKVLSLKRIAMGPLRLGNLQPGESRPLRSEEIEELYQAAQQSGRKMDNSAQRRRTAGVPSSTAAGHASPAKAHRGQVGGVQPIIDRSLPPDTEIEELDLLSADIHENAGGVSHAQTSSDWKDSEAADEDSLADGTDISLAEMETTPIDLSPLGAKRSRKQKRRTVIGGDPTGSAGRRRRFRRQRDRHSSPQQSKRR
ncbi:MAG TPA: pseudouridine synthase [Pirellulales bacterium]|nr:pseudouridine synthase [Pirellulales bacterium]